jgi:hypothetical protein
MYINTATSQYPISEQEIRAAHPNTSFPQPFTPPEGYAWVFPAPQPTYDSVTHGVREIAPALTTKGHWEQRWETVALDAEVVTANQASRAEQIKASIVQATQARLDAFARERSYDDIKSASDYAGCSVPRFATEGTYCRDARAETWDALYTMLAEVQAGTRPMPSGFADIEPELPALVWPTV